MAASDLLHQVLERIVTLISSVVECDSCFVYILEDDELVLRASNNPHPEAVDRLKLRVGQGITGWVAEHLEPVALARDAFQDRVSITSANCRRSPMKPSCRCRSFAAAGWWG